MQKENTILEVSTLPELNEYATLLHENGFRIMYPENISTYLFFERAGNIGYVECEKYGGFSFGSENKPCKECGTGFGIHSDIGTPTIKHAEDTFCLAPHWATHRDAASVKKWKSLEEKQADNKILNYIIIN